MKSAPRAMNMRKALMSLAFVLMAVASGLGPSTSRGVAAQAPVRPNIVWISTEDMSPHLGAYGDRFARTPVLDKLAR